MDTDIPVFLKRARNEPPKVYDTPALSNVELVQQEERRKAGTDHVDRRIADIEREEQQRAKTELRIRRLKESKGIKDPGDELVRYGGRQIPKRRYDRIVAARKAQAEKDWAEHFGKRKKRK